MNDEASEALQLMKQEAALLRERAKVRPCVSESPEGLRKAQKGSDSRRARRWAAQIAAMGPCMRPLCIETHPRTEDGNI